jgi:hypothetical protein
MAFPPIRRSKFSLIFLIVTLLLSGCITRVPPWERDLLAEKKMQLIPDPMENEMDGKVYFSKEGTYGGPGIGGGGCGCN